MTAHSGWIAWTLSRRITVLMAFLLVVLLGVTAYALLAVELLPSGFAERSATVFVPVLAGTPLEIQEQVVRPTEELVRTIPGVTEVTTRARQNDARIEVKFGRGVDIALGVAELRDRVERARASWPEDVREYSIFQFNLDTDLPVFSFAIDLERMGDERVTSFIDEKVIRPLENLPGVARVTCWGLLDEQVRIRVSEARARALGLSIYELTKVLQESNLELAAGEIEEGQVRFAVRNDARIRDLASLRNLPIRKDGLKLGDIALIEPAQAVREFVALSRNQPALWVQVYKESTANTVATATRIRDFVKDVLANDERLKDLGAVPRLYQRADIGNMVVRALEGLQETALQGAGLALLILILFLRRLGPTLVIVFCIPLSLFITLAWLWFSGDSLNLLSMLGITIAIGLLIDNAIVVVENIARWRAMGANPVMAARRGAEEVAFAITLSTLTTLAAFLPVAFLGGVDEIRFFATALGVPLCVAVFASLLVALFFIPLATVLFAGRAATAAAPLAEVREAIALRSADRPLARFVGACLKQRFWTLVIVLGIIGPLTAAAMKSLPKVDFQSDSGGQISVDVRFDDNTTLYEANQRMLEYGAWLESHAGELSIEHFWCFFRRNSGSLLIDLNHRDMLLTREAARRLKDAMPALAGARLDFKVESGQSEERGKIVIDFFGPEPRQLVELSEPITERIESLPGVLSVKIDVERATPELHVRPDREALTRQGIDPRALRGTITYGVRGFRISDLDFETKKIPLIIEYEGAATLDLPDLSELPIPNDEGRTTPLSAVATLTATQGLGEIRRRDGQSSIRWTIDAGDVPPAELAPKIRAALSDLSLPEGYAFQSLQLSTLDTAMSEVFIALGLGAILVFLLMGILFESVILPLAILVAIPFSWCGAALALAVTNTPIDMVGFISAIVLVGIVVNNGIVLIDRAQRLRDEGIERDLALRIAVSQRLRPILMTALTTIVGLIPMAVSDGAGSEISYKALSRALIGGLLVSTVFTLLFVPIAYALLDDFRGLFQGLFRAHANRRITPAEEQSAGA